MTTDAAEGATSRRRGRGAPDKRDAILAAAARLFASEGFDRTTIRRIAGAAGVAEGTIYLYFGSKREILLAFLELVAVNSLADYFREAAGKSDSEIVHGFLINRYRLWETHGDLIKAMYGTALFDNELAGAFCRAVVLPATVLIESYIARRVREGAFRAAEVGVVARGLVGHVFGPVLLYDCLASGSARRFTAEQYAAEFTALFLEGIRASTSS